MADNDSKKKPDFRMCDIIDAYMASKDSEDSAGQEELRKVFPIHVVLVCFRIVIEELMDFITALGESEDAEKVIEVIRQSMEGVEINRLIDFYGTTSALEYAWENCRLEDGNIFVDNDKIKID